MAVVYHWKHGWIPLDHTAALSKAKGNHALAARMLGDAHHSQGITSRQHVAKAVLDFPNVPSHEQQSAATQLGHAASMHNSTDLLPARLQIRAGVYRGESGFNVTGTDTHGRSVRVFTPGERNAAEAVVANKKAGRDAFDNGAQHGTVTAPGAWTAHQMADGSIQLRSKNGVELGRVRQVTTGKKKGQWEARAEGRHGADYGDSPEKVIDALYDSFHGKSGEAALARSGGSPEERRLAAYKASIAAHQASMSADSSPFQRDPSATSRPSAPSAQEMERAQSHADATTSATMAKITNANLIANIEKYRRTSPNSPTLRILLKEAHRRGLSV